MQLQIIFISLRFNCAYVILTAPASIKVSVWISSKAAGSSVPGASFSPHPVLKFPKCIQMCNQCILQDIAQGISSFN